ncbi:MAG: rod shape-determining protein MreD [Candidatus Omnitrophota bacterium]
MLSKINLFKLLFMLIILAVVQSSFFNYFTFLSMRPNLVLIFIIYFTMYTRLKVAVCISILGGIILDLFSVGIFGISAIAYSGVAVGLNKIAAHINRESILAQMIITMVAVISSDLIYYLMIKIFMPQVEFYSPILRIILPTAVISAFLTPILFEIFRRFLKFEKLYFTVKTVPEYPAGQH